jgi:serine/threonine protein phosphatase PrpC
MSSPLTIEPFQSAASAIEADIAGATSCGLQSSYNTDHYLAVRLSRLQETIITSLASGDVPPFYEEHAYALVVADGLGEGLAAARASRAALSALAHVAIRYGKWNVRVTPETAADIREQAELFYRVANEVVRTSGDAAQLGTIAASVTAVYIAGTSLFFAHAGHSRAFLFRNGSLIQLTTDHTQQARGVPEPEPGTPDQPARVMIDRHHLVTEALGGRTGGPNVEIEHVQLWSGDRVLLCTNGLTDVVFEDEIANVLALQREPQDNCNRLIDLALRNGSPDDVTVLAADYRIRGGS